MSLFSDTAADMLWHGFEFGDPNDVSDRPVQNMLYFKRVLPNEVHEYVSLMFGFDDDFLEAVVERLAEPKNKTKGKRVTPLACYIRRDLAELLSELAPLS